MQLKYNDGTTPQYNGNIANQCWGTPSSLSSNYTYAYDYLNRLRSGIANTNNTEKSITYDDLGNITGMERYLAGTKIDGLKYSYANGSSDQTNKLFTITDSTSNDAGLKHGTFTYAYDGNGNMTTDNSKGLTITYNLLNLPLVNTLVGGTITYTYDANGKKLRRVSTVGTGNTTEYINGLQYNGTVIDFVQTGEGRILNSGGSYNYQYNLADQLGNTRLSFNSTAATIQQDDYYPFGMEINRSVTTPKNEYLYNRKELQEELGQYDYGARFYDPVIGRWTSVDPLAEKYRKWSPYNYGVDNPVRFTDPDGMAPEGCCGFPSWKDVKEIYHAAKKETNQILDGAAQMLTDGPFVTANKIDKAGGVEGMVGRLGGSIGSNTAKYVSGSNSDQNEVIGTALPNVALLAIPESRVATVGDVAKVARASEEVATGGRLGSASTREQIYNIGTNLESRGFTVTGGGGRLAEEYLQPLGGGRKGGSYPDITAVRDNTTVRINTVDINRAGNPTTRELRNASRIRSQTPGDHLVLIPKSN